MSTNNTRHVYTILRSGERRTNSPDGGPRWTLRTDAGVYRTADDSQSGYVAANMVEGSESSRIGKHVRLTLDSRRDIIELAPVEQFKVTGLTVHAVGGLREYASSLGDRHPIEVSWTATTATFYAKWRGDVVMALDAMVSAAARAGDESRKRGLQTVRRRFNAQHPHPGTARA